MKIVRNVFLATFLLSLPAISVVAQDTSITRDDFAMNSVSGGEFRRYVTEQVTASESSYERQWQYSMQTLGVFHNVMHEMMTDLARYGESTYPTAALPDFSFRISGGQWTEYQQALAEEFPAEHPWRYFVNVMEVMHDRVHHVMLNAMRYDIEVFERETALAEYVSDDRMPHAEADTLPAPAELKLASVHKDTLRDFVWHGDYDNEYLHAALQKLMAFDVMLRDLQSQWLVYANNPANPALDEACRYQLDGGMMGIGEWYDYAQRSECGNEQWRHLIRVTDLMQRRVNHMAAALMMEQGVIE